MLIYLLSYNHTDCKLFCRFTLSQVEVSIPTITHASVALPNFEVGLLFNFWSSPISTLACRHLWKHPYVPTSICPKPVFFHLLLLLFEKRWTLTNTTFLLDYIALLINVVKLDSSLFYFRIHVCVLNFNLVFLNCSFFWL